MISNEHNNNNKLMAVETIYSSAIKVPYLKMLRQCQSSVKVNLNL